MSVGRGGSVGEGAGPDVSVGGGGSGVTPPPPLGGCVGGTGDNVGVAGRGGK